MSDTDQLREHVRDWLCDLPPADWAALTADVQDHHDRRARQTPVSAPADTDQHQNRSTNP